MPPQTLHLTVRSPIAGLALANFTDTAARRLGITVGHHWDGFDETDFIEHQHACWSRPRWRPDRIIDVRVAADAGLVAPLASTATSLTSQLPGT
jgi:hypothetical protein